MDKMDKLIADALAEEDRQASAREPAFLLQALGLYRGRNAWVWSVMTLAQTVMFFAGAWLAWQFFRTEDVIMTLRYGFSASVLLLAATILKLSLMPVIEANRIIREIRRLEIAQLLQRKHGEGHASDA